MADSEVDAAADAIAPRLNASIDPPDGATDAPRRGRRWRDVVLVVFGLLLAYALLSIGWFGDPATGWTVLIVAIGVGVLRLALGVPRSSRPGFGCLGACLLPLLFLATAPYGASWRPVQLFELRFALRHGSFDQMAHDLMASGAEGDLDGTGHRGASFARTIGGSGVDPEPPRHQGPTSIAGVPVLASVVSPEGVDFCLRGTLADREGSFTQCSAAYTFQAGDRHPATVSRNFTVDCGPITYPLGDGWTYVESKCVF